MNPDIPEVEPGMMLSTLEDIHQRFKYPVYPVFDGVRFIGTITISRVFELSHEAHETTAVAELLDPGTVILSSDANAQQALTRLQQTRVPLILIYDEEDTTKFVGFVTQAEINQIYASFEEGEFRELDTSL
jgi:predicted transcriptional regulator